MNSSFDIGVEDDDEIGSLIGSKPIPPQSIRQAPTITALTPAKNMSRDVDKVKINPRFDMK